MGRNGPDRSTVRARIGRTARLCLGLLLSLGAGAAPAASHRAGPPAVPAAREEPYSIILGNPSPASIVAGILTAATLEGYIEYGTRAGDPAMQTGTVVIPGNAPRSVTLDRLQADCDYFYRFRYRAPGETVYQTGTEAHFHTPRLPGSSYTFTIQSDPHVNDAGFVPDLYRQTLANARSDQPDLHIDLGDTFLTEKLAGTAAEEIQTFLDGHPYFGLIGASASLCLVNGNHEGELGWENNGTADNRAVRSTLNRRSVYPCPVPGDFYSGSIAPEPFIGVRDGHYAWTWGDALLVVLDPYWCTAPKPNGTTVDNWGWTLGWEQYDWLKRTLEASASPFKFVFIHHLAGGLGPQARGGVEAAPYFEWGGRNPDGSDGFPTHRPGWPMPIHGLLVANGVSAVFHGHDHTFVAQELDGIVYQECPRPSFHQRDAAADAAAAGYASGVILPSPGHIRVRVEASEARVEYVRASISDPGLNGSVAFSYALRPSTDSLSPSFSYSPPQPEAGQAVQFVDTSAGGPTSWSWDFGDGGASSLQNPIHAYSAPGSYTVSLTVGGAGDSDWTARDILVTARPPGAFPGSIVLGCPTASSVRANLFSPDEGGEVFLEYGTSAGVYEIMTPAGTLAAGTPLEILIDGLSPDTQYYYRTAFQPTGAAEFTAGPEHRFRTARPPGSAFTFCLQGDSHPERQPAQFQPELYSRTLLTAGGDEPDFYIAMGDDFSVDTLDPATVTEVQVAERYAIQRPYLGLIGRRAPVFLVNGNHEQAALYLLDGTPDNVAVWAQNARNRHFAQPAPDSFYTGNQVWVPFIGLLRNYFAWTWGDALFVVIDFYWGSPECVDNPFDGGPKNPAPWDITLGDAQYLWLKNTLERSRAAYKFVFAHHVLGSGRGGLERADLCEWGGQNPNGSWGFGDRRPAWRLPIHQLMASTGVTIFFQGHDHIWVRQEKDGVIYQSLPEPADPNYTLYNAEAYTTGDKFSNTGYTRVHVSPAGGRVDYVRTYLPADEGPGRENGSVAFSYSFLPSGVATARCGDADGSGTVDGADLLLLAGALTGDLPADDGIMPYLDLNQSGALDVVDLFLLQLHLAGQIDPLECGGGMSPNAFSAIGSD